MLRLIYLLILEQHNETRESLSPTGAPRRSDRLKGHVSATKQIFDMNVLLAGNPQLAVMRCGGS